MPAHWPIVAIITLLLTTEGFEEELTSNSSNGDELIKFGNQKFSAPPSGLPFRSANFLGNRILLRQIFVEPLRSTGNGTLSTDSRNELEVRRRDDNDDGASENIVIVTEGCTQRRRRRRSRRRRKRQGCGCRGCCGRCGGCGNSVCNQQQRQRGNGGGYYQQRVPMFQQQRQPFIVPTSPLPYQIQPQLSQNNNQQQSSPNAQQQQQQQQAWQLEGQQQRAYPSGINYNHRVASPFSTFRNPPFLPQYEQPQRGNQLGPSYPSHFSGYSNIPPSKVYSKYPLPECYTDDSNFMCCNAQLEETIDQAFQHLIDTIPNFHRCNTQRISNAVQAFAEKRFNISFEVVTGLTDYSSKSHFYSNYICKVEKEKRYILAYATPRWDLEDRPDSEESGDEPSDASKATLSGSNTNNRYPISPSKRIQNNNVMVL